MNADQFLKDFQDYMAPTMDIYEQTIYIYIIRHSRLVGQEDAVIGFKSARKKLGFGAGTAQTPPSESTVYEKLSSLSKKGYIKIFGSERMGTRIKPFLPNEIAGLCKPAIEAQDIDIEEMDFFEIPENRLLILQRDNNECFYCKAKLNSENHVMEHVVSRPNGNNSYRNIVASCRACNNKKGADDAASFIRALYRNNLLSSDELQDVTNKLEKLKNGLLQPKIKSS